MQLRIAGLSSDTVNEDLMPLFTTIGKVGFITVIKDITTGKSKGYAIVRMPDDRTAQEAINRLNGSMVKGSRIAVSRMPETLPGEMEFREWLVDNADRVLRQVGIMEGHTILDFGCGPGIFTIPAAAIAGGNGVVIGLDIRPQPLERVREKAREAGLKNIRTILAESPDLRTGLPVESIDVILVFDMLHTITNRRGLFQELYRILRTHGFISIFPMHLGTVKLLEIVDASPLFSVRDRLSLPGYNSPSEVVNLTKRKPTTKIR